MLILLLYGILLPVILTSTDGVIKTILLYAHACGFMVWCQSSTRPRDMYGLKHFRLNLQLPPRTFWCNVGYWTDDSTDFPKACERLVLTVVDQLGIQAGDRLLDVGYGCGDSCFFISNRFDCQVTGITNEHTQWRLAQDRCDALPKSHREKLTLLQGSAVELDKALMQDDTQSVFDHIVSIDSAYHYNTRQAFFQQARDHLKPNGALGLYDLVLHDEVDLTTTRWRRLFLKVICKALRLPLHNMVDQVTYQAYLEQAGYHHIEFNRLPPNQVFGGLSRHCLRQRQKMKAWKIGNWQDMLYLTISSNLFGQLASHRWLQPVVVKAQAAGGD